MKLCALLLFTSMASTAVFSIDPEVTIPLGTIHGRKVFVNDEYVHEYLGIPYAKPPIDDLRFAKPEPITEKWESPYKARSFPIACMQNLFNLSMPINEDCLYLNVFVVESRNNESIKQLKPVLFWIHGGGFYGGSSSLYNGSMLAKLSNCVIVTINYRLNVFGFLFGNNDKAPGNVGLYDQLLAMKWVNENIVYFGGDKNMVTIFGQSAGAWSVSLHLVSPLSRPYYKKAIVMSGVDIDYLAAAPKYLALKRAKALASVVGCNFTSDPPALPPEVIKCLKEKNSNTLLKATNDNRVKFATKFLMYDKPFLPIFKDEFLPLSPKDVWKRKQFKQNTTLLIGTVYNEIMAGNAVPADMKPTDAVKWYCENLVPEFLTISECNEMIRIYFTGINETRNRQQAIDTVTQLYNDVIGHCPSISFAEAFSEVNNVYQYFFNYKSKNDIPICGPKYPCHQSDIPFTFGNVKNKKDVFASHVWIEIVAGFAKIGKVFWPEYYRTSVGELVPVYYEFRGNKLPKNTHIALKSWECQIWKSFILKERNVTNNDVL